eukprot:7727511-Pyramimonas_sp.AAC.1
MKGICNNFPYSSISLVAMQPGWSRHAFSHDGDAPLYIPEDTHPGYADGVRGDCNPRSWVLPNLSWTWPMAARPPQLRRR